MKKLSIVLFITLSCICIKAQEVGKLKEIINELNSYNTYKANCNYTFSMPYGDPMTFESLIVTQQIPNDTLCGFNYNFSTHENYRGEDFGDFNCYFNQAVYKSYQSKVKTIRFSEKPEKFVDIKDGYGTHPACQRSHLLYHHIPQVFADRLSDLIEDENYSIIQLADTLIMEQECLRFNINSKEFCNDSAAINNLKYDLCFDKLGLYPVYYKQDIKSNIINSIDIAYFKDTEINQVLPEDYFTEANLIPNEEHPLEESVAKKKLCDLVGKNAPAWELPILGCNERLSNKDLLGKYVLLDFTATWCGNCMNAAKMMNRLEERFGDSNNIEMVSIFSSRIDKKECIQKFVEKFGMKSTILYDAKEIGDNYYVFGYPNFVIISPKGKVLLTFGGFGTSVENNLISMLSSFTE